MRWSAVLLAAVACGDAAPPAETPLETARARFPRFIELHQGVIARTCSPNPGVCHNSASYPDLSTPANVLAILGAPCNLEMPDPLQGWDACERPADRAMTSGFSAEVAWSERVELGVWRFGLREAAVETATKAVWFERADGAVAFALDAGPDRHAAWTEIALAAGSHTATVTVRALALPATYRSTYDPALARVVPGDPNRNGVFGAEQGERASLLAAGVLEASYLWRRINGTVPGSRMPLANMPLSPDEYLAIACFIEGLAGATRSSPDVFIDYDVCAAAAVPVEVLIGP